MKIYLAVAILAMTQTTHANDTSGGKNLDTSTETIAPQVTRPACASGTTELYKSGSVISALIAQFFCAGNNNNLKSHEQQPDAKYSTLSSGDVQINKQE